MDGDGEALMTASSTRDQRTGEAMERCASQQSVSSQSERVRRTVWRRPQKLARSENCACVLCARRVYVCMCVVEI